MTVAVAAVLVAGAGYLGSSFLGGSPRPTPPAPPVATAQPTAAAEPVRTPAPSADGRPSFPGAGSTGVPTDRKLTVVDGDYQVTTAGAVVEDLDIRGSLSIEAPNVTVRYVRVTCSNNHWVVQAKQPGFTITDSTLTVDRSRPENYCQYGITAGDNATISRNDISFTPDGLTFVGTSALVNDNWIHDQIAYPGHDDHVDAAQLNGGSPGPFVFRGNHFSVPEGQTGCLALFADFGPIRNVTAEGNLFDGAGYAVYGGTATATDVRFTGNWFGRTHFPTGGRFGPVAYYSPIGSGNVWTDNKWLDTGEPVLP